MALVDGDGVSARALHEFLTERCLCCATPIPTKHIQLCGLCWAGRDDYKLWTLSVEALWLMRRYALDHALRLVARRAVCFCGVQPSPPLVMWREILMRAQIALVAGDWTRETP